VRTAGHLQCTDSPLYSLARFIRVQRVITGSHLGVASRKSHAAGTEYLLHVRHPATSFVLQPEHAIWYRRLSDGSVEISS
jgi:hypothetical protein